MNSIKIGEVRVSKLRLLLFGTVHSADHLCYYVGVPDEGDYNTCCHDAGYLYWGPLNDL